MKSISRNAILSSLSLLAVLQVTPAQPAWGATDHSLPTPASVAAPAPAPRPLASFDATLFYRDRLITEDTVWRGQVLVEGVVTVGPQATLTVEPGTVVRFRRGSGQPPALMIQGRLVILGSREEPVRLTSGFETPAAGDWQGVLLLGTEKKNQLENCLIEGAQTGLEVDFSNVTLRNVAAGHSSTGMRFQEAVVLMEGGGASGCDTGLLFSESESTVRGAKVSGNRVGVSGKRSSLYLSEVVVSGNKEAGLSADGCRLRFLGGALTGNGCGATLLGCEGAITGARLVRNRDFGLSLTTSRMRINGNLVTGNGQNGIMVFDSSPLAWDNAFFENAGYDVYNAGTEEFRAPGNWWGAGTPKIFDNNGRGKVMNTPLLPARPEWTLGQ
ncbi:lipoprotein [Geomonas sp. Red276]